MARAIFVFGLENSLFPTCLESDSENQSPKCIQSETYHKSKLLNFRFFEFWKVEKIENEAFELELSAPINGQLVLKNIILSWKIVKNKVLPVNAPRGGTQSRTATTRVATSTRVCRNLLPGLDPIQAVNFLFRFLPVSFSPTESRNCKI